MKLKKPKNAPTLWNYRKNMKKLLTVYLLIFTFCLFTFAQNLTVRDIMREPSLAGMRADSERISPDGTKVIFSWNAENKEPRNLYLWENGSARILVKAEENFEQRTLPPESKLNYGLIVRDDFVKAREKNLGGTDFSPDSKKILFSQNSDIYVLDLTNSAAKPRRITRTQGFEAGARWLTNDSILYSSNGNYFVLNLKETSLVQVTKEANPAAFVTIFNVAATEDAKLLAYVVSDGSRQRALFVPNYLDEYTTAPTFRRGWTEQRVLVNPLDGSRETPFEVKLPKAEGVSYIRSIKWAADNQSLLVDRIDKDTKRRQLFYVFNVGSKAEKLITVTEETDDKWVAGLSRLVEPNPKDASQVVFGSERDGYNHLYLATLERAKSDANPTGEVRQENPTNAGFSGKVEIKQLTKGNFEVDWVKWSSDDRLIFSSTEANTAEREFYHLLPATGTKSLIGTGQKGMKISPQIAEPGKQTSKFIYSFSQWNQPTDIYMQSSCNVKCEMAEPVQITKSTPESFKKIAWTAPKFIDIPARDGKPIKSKIYLPSNFDKTKKYPMVIFVHGAGYLQNTINGWNNYYREYMFNDLLTRKGYVILDIDYRGSAGYGRDWRTDVYDFLGGKDYEDHLDAIDYMVKNYAVDAKKVGAYGGSYGGFMAEMLAFRTDKITCAAALRPVADWKNYYASSNIYTTERLGFPDKNPEGYKRSSPIAYADGLNKPLLILHGLVDDNVHAQDSMQLIEKLMRLEKTQYFEAMLYPAENHGFTRPTSWADEYERILSFFEKHLK
jgi:dipeptidyl aminopeptidase/acylaminoacyl peptidase